MTRTLESLEEDVSALEANSRFKRYKTAVTLGVVATSTALTLASDPISKVHQFISETGPWVGVGYAAGEVAWSGGAAMMLAASGSKIGNPLTLHKRLSEIGQGIRNSRLMKAGFAINMTGAAGQLGVVTAGILELPPRSWGLLSIPAYDLAITALRGAGTWALIKSPKDKEGESGVFTETG